MNKDLKNYMMASSLLETNARLVAIEELLTKIYYLLQDRID